MRVCNRGKDTDTNGIMSAGAVVKWIDIIVALTVIALFVVIMRSCGGYGPNVVIRERIDTVTVIVPSIELRNAPGRTRIIHDTLRDTTAIYALLNTVDSLQRTVAGMGARRVFTLDTITQRGDTVYVACDETYKRISLRVRPAPVDTLIRRVDTLTIERGKLHRSLTSNYAQITATVNAQGAATAQANVGLRLHLADNAAPFIDAGWNLINGPLIRIGLEIIF